MKIHDMAKAGTDKTDKTPSSMSSGLASSTASVDKPPQAGVRVIGGHPALWSVEVVTPKAPDGFSAAISPEKRMIPSHLYYGENAEQVAKAFYDQLGAYWREVSDLRGSAKPEHLVVAILDLLRLVAPAAGVDPAHDAHKALIVAREYVEAVSNSNRETMRSRAAQQIRGFAVSFVEQGYAAVRDSNGKPLSKDSIRQIVVQALEPFSEVLPKGGARTVEGLRDWERGHGVKKPMTVPLGLREGMTPGEFGANVANSFRNILTVTRFALSGGG